MAPRVCPWWIGYFLTCPLRRYGQDPGKILEPYVREGMTVLEPGPGMGFFTLELARRVGPRGRVVAVDLQAKMIERLSKRAARTGLLPRIDARIAALDSAALADCRNQVDFTLIFAVVHEIPEIAGFFSAIAAASKPGATALMAEPRGHVTATQFAFELEAARAAGFTAENGPPIRRSLTALLRKLPGA